MREHAKDFVDLVGNYGTESLVKYYKEAIKQKLDQSPVKVKLANIDKLTKRPYSLNTRECEMFDKINEIVEYLNGPARPFND